MKACVKRWLDEQMGGSDGATAEAIYAEYRATADRLLAELSAVRAQGITAEATVARVAHTLKGCAAMVGDLPLQEAIAQWRDAFKKAGDGAAEAALWSMILDEVKAIG